MSNESLLTGAEEKLKERFKKEGGIKGRLPSTAAAPAPSVRIDTLVLRDEERGAMPFTKDKFLIRENPHLVQWERETRKFLRKLSPDHGHRVTAVMIYEWATGIKVADIMVEEQKKTANSGPHTTWRGDLRKINKALEFYFGKPYMTWIMGRKVAKAYTVKPGYYIRRHRPMTLTLYAEYVEGTLNP